VVGLKTVQSAVVKRLSGGKPSRLRASVSAAVTGGVVAATVYRGLRS
jgi:hypothetical protein